MYTVHNAAQNIRVRFFFCSFHWLGISKRNFTNILSRPMHT